MATTFVDYTGDGNATKAFSFPSYKEADIKVDVDGVVKSSGTHYNITSYTTTGGGNVVFTSGNIPSSPAAIRIYRDTDVDTAKATFTAGSAVKAADLNNNMTQLLYAAQEEQNQTIVASDLKDSIITSAKIVDGTIATADIADDAVTAAKLASDAVVTASIVDANVTTAKVADDAITADKLANTAVTAGSYTAADITVDAQGRVTAASSGAIATSEITDGAVTTAKLGADSVTGAKIADDAINSEHYTDGSIDTAHIADSQVTTAKIAADAITGAKIADDAVDSEHFVDGSIDTAHLGGAQVTDAKLASNSVITSKITDANVTTVKIADSNITLAKLASDLKQTTIADSDTQLPTSGAVVDYVAAQLAPIGGLEVIADEDNFPTTQPASGVVISISDAAGIVVNGSGTSTTARTAGNGSDNVTINNFPSSLNGETLATGVGLMVTSTGSSQIYNYHKLLAAETDVKRLSDDINDFNARYRVNAGEPGSDNDEGDLVFDTAANKMKVYDGSSWGEVTSTGDFKYLFLCPAGGTGAPTLDGSIATYDLRESSNSGTVASITSAAQLLVSVNGIIQKANTGTSAPAEGFALVDSNTIIFGANLASGDSVFIVQIGSAISPVTPADGTVTTAKLGSSAVTTAKIADDAITNAKIADDAINSEHYTDGSIDTAHIADLQVTTAKIAADAITGAKLADDAVDSEHYTDGSIDTAHIADLQVTTGKLAADAVTGAKIADDAIDSEHYTDGSIDTAHIADDQVTLAKMAGLARGKIIYGDSSGNPAALTVGSSGQTIVSDGTDLSWGDAAAGATGGGSDKIFWENGQTITTNYTITNNHNAMSAGPITINNGIAVTIGTGEYWTIV